MKDVKLQWHPALDAALQIELEENLSDLIFDAEHLLSKKPMQIDLLIIKKRSDVHIHKNIGHIFKGHNIIEYKSPEDYLSTYDYYKILGYACFYVADTETVGDINPNDVTITFICSHYPYKMVRHMQEVRKAAVSRYDNGIYYFQGDIFSIQLIITGQLSKTVNYWLQSLRNDLKAGGEIRELIARYEKKRTSPRYQALVDVILRANWEEVEVEREMCDALRELFADELKESEEKGAERVLQLTKLLLNDNRMEDLKKAADSPEFCARLMEEYHI